MPGNPRRLYIGISIDPGNEGPHPEEAVYPGTKGTETADTVYIRSQGPKTAEAVEPRSPAQEQEISVISGTQGYIHRGSRRNRIQGNMIPRYADDAKQQ